MKLHELKTWPDFFQATADGIKKFEVRKDDRNFEVGDLLHLREFDPKHEKYTGRNLLVRVTYKLAGMYAPPEYCVLSIEMVINLEGK